ncbi:putative trans-sialidase, Group V [Trypanosoma cruzi]|uniref:Putative trans-sialidase, Group V n=1 Tax=Trypanosoma cruzi TaxID=5693 RepID=A0A2V2V8D3_TRYCR|nr:putative trans-sialidase, Group V [Trypanosoma cruzi]
MPSRAAAVKAPRTHNRRRVTGSSGRRREEGESEPQKPNMSRHLFYSAVLLLVVMLCCGSCAAGVAVPSPSPLFEWKGINDGGGETVESLGAPSLLKVGSDVFAVAEAQCKKGDFSFTGVASQPLKTPTADPPEEVLKKPEDKTQVLEENVSQNRKKKLDVSRPTTAVKGSDIYMLAGAYNEVAASGEDVSVTESGLLLVKGSVNSGEGTSNKKIDWEVTESSLQIVDAQSDSWTRLIGSGGSGVKMKDETLVFPVEGTKKAAVGGEDVKTVSLIIYSKDNTNWTLSKGMSADGCGVPSVVEWKDDKLMMMTACDDGRRRVYESGDMGESWTEALGTLSRVWGNKKGEKVEIVGSGFITATIDDVKDNRNVMLATLPVYSNRKEKEKGELHLWLTDNTHIVDIGPVSREDDDAAASSLLYNSGENTDEKKVELIALYEKKKGGGEKPSLGMVSVLLTEQLERVKDVLATWKEVDKRVSQLCATLLAEKDPSTGDVCSAVKITAGLVGFLSGNFSDGTWRDEYLGVNATVNNEGGAAKVEDGVKFTGRGAGAQWPVGKQGQNQLYHFANYNFTLVATVSIDKVPEGNTPIPLIGVRAGSNGNENNVLLGLSYNSGKKWHVLCGDGKTDEVSSTWETETPQHVVILLKNGTQCSVYVDGQRVGNGECALGNGESKEISHFYIGGDGENKESREEGVSVTVTNVLLYNRPWDEAEITALNPNKAPTPSPVNEPSQETAIETSPGQGKEEQRQSMGSSKGAGSGGSTADGDPAVGTREEGTDGQKEEIHAQNGDVKAAALSSSLGNLSQGNDSDAGSVCGSGLLPLLLLLGLWGSRLCEE